MKKEILEEVNRVREIMGLKLISEAAGPKPRTAGQFILSLFKGEIEGFSQKAGKETAQESLKGLEGRTKNMARDTANSIENYAQQVLRGEMTALKFEELVDKLLTAEEKLTLVRRIAMKSPQVMDNYIVALLSSKGTGTYQDFIKLIKQGHTLNSEYAQNYIKQVSAANPKFYDKKILETMWTDIESGQYKFADELDIPIEGRVKPKPRPQADITFVFDQDEISRIRDTEQAIEVPEGAIKDFLTQNYKRFKKLSPEQQKKLVDQVASETANWFENTLTKSGVEKDFANVQNLFNSTKIGPDEQMKLVKEAINKINPSLGPLQNTLDWLFNYFVGYNLRTGQNILQNGNWAKALKGWMLMNAIYAVGMSIGNYVVTADEDPDTLGDNALKIFFNRTDAIGFLTRLIPIPALLRAILEVATEKAIEYKPIRMPSSQEVLDRFKEGSMRKKVTERPDYEERKDLFEPFKDVSVWVVKENEDLGVWYYNPEKEEFVAVYEPKKISGKEEKPKETEISPATIDEWKTWYKSKFKKDDNFISQMTISVDSSDNTKIIVSKGEKTVNYKKIAENNFKQVQ